MNFSLTFDISLFLFRFNGSAAVHSYCSSVFILLYFTLGVGLVLLLIDWYYIIDVIIMECMCLLVVI